MPNIELFTEIIGIRELQVVDVSTYEDRYEIWVNSILAEGICPKCTCKCSKVKTFKNRTVQDLPISGKKVILHVEVRQFECECGNYFYEPFGFVRPYKRLTVRYEADLYKRSKGVDSTYLAKQENLDWRTVDGLTDTYAQQEIASREDWDKVTHLALDEIAVKKGHKNYVVIVLDLLNGVILDILPQRDKEFLVSYFQEKGQSFCEQIQVFCSDMWKAYLGCAKQVFTNAKIVADRFHFFAKCQEGIDHARKSFRKLFPKAEELKKLQWALRKNPDNLSVKERDKLEKVFEKEEFHLLRLTWDARNTLKDIFDGPFTSAQAEVLIDEWIEGVKKYKIRYLFKFIEFYQEWKTIILNYFDGRFSTGKLEGTNNKLKLIKRRAFGFSKLERFKNKAMVEFF